MSLRVAWYHWHQGYLDNHIFELGWDRDHVSYPWFFLKQYLKDRDIDIQSYDMFERNGIQPDLYIFQNLTKRSLLYILSRSIPRHRRLLIAWETKIASRRFHSFQDLMWTILYRWPNFFPIILTYDHQLIDGKQFRRIYFPQPFFESFKTYWERDKHRMAVMIVSDKQSRTAGENYSIRRQLLDYFEQNHADVFDLYGMGWNEPHTRLERLFPKSAFYTPLYRGLCDDKLDVLANYKFTFCPDNQRYPDYIDEKILDALSAGSVPIYLGAPNVADYIPPDCFIDWQQFLSFDPLYKEMKAVASSDRLKQMQQKGWEFLHSKTFYPFTVEHFSETIYQAICDLATINENHQATH